MKNQVIITTTCKVQIAERRFNIKNSNKTDNTSTMNFILGGVTGCLLTFVIVMIFVLKRCKKREVARETQISVSNSHLEGIERITYCHVKQSCEESDEKQPLSDKKYAFKINENV